MPEDVYGEIALENMLFYAYHGVLHPERNVGNRFEVNIFLRTSLAAAAQSDDVRQTVDYSRVYLIVERHMQTPRNLLETLAYRIAEELLEAYAIIHSARVQVAKFNPPIDGLCERAAVTAELARSS